MKLTNQQYEKIYKEIKFLATKIPGYYKLNLDDQSIAINNAFMYLIKKMETEKVPCDDYKNYKGYMFITTRNSVLKFWVKEKRKLYPNYTDKVKEFDTVTFNYSFDKISLDGLTPFQKAIFRFRRRGWQVSEIAKATGYSNSAMRLKLNKVIDILQQQYI